MSRGLGQMQQLILASLKPAKRAHAEGKFNYIGAASEESGLHKKLMAKSSCAKPENS